MQWVRTTLPAVACPALKYFPTLSHKEHDFRGGKNKLKNIGHKMCILIFSRIFVRNSSKKKWARYDQKYRAL